jgi:hypothetical protein
MAPRRKLERDGGMSDATPTASMPRMSSDTFALAACTVTEVRMFTLIRAGENPTYKDFVERGIRSEAIAPGIRVLVGLGLITVERSGNRNVYAPSDGWREIAPSSAEDKAGRQRVRDLARTIRHADGKQTEVAK